VKSRIVIVHSDRKARKYLEAACALRHQTVSPGDLKTALKIIIKQKPALVLAGLDPVKKEAMVLMRYMKQYGATTPVIVVGGRGAGALQAAAMKAGAIAFLEFPVEQSRLDREISKAVQADIEASDALPPLTDEEIGANLTELEKKLNRHMLCPSGKNQVYIQSLIVGPRKTPPRISLKCPLRREFGLKPDVYYEYIRDVCCNDPSACPAVQMFQAKNSA
jgi:FixJ family two-component response regulator